MPTPRELIQTARHIVVDNDAVDLRQADTELLGYFNDGMKEASGLQPELFTSIGDFLCTPGAAEQAVTFLDAQEIVDVLCIHGGEALTRFDMKILDAYMPGWRNATPAAAKQWAPFDGSKLKFFIYPPAPMTSQTLDVQYVRNPVALGLDDQITEIPVSLIPAMVDYIIYRAESKDDEHVLSQRAAMHYESFKSKVKGS